MVLPNTLLMGVQKAGTTAIHDWMSQHPDVFAPPHAKEFRFFIEDEYYKRGPEFYSRLFKKWNGEKVVLAGHVSNIYFGRAIERIKQFNPEIKMIVMLRNPIDRAYSAYRYAVQRSIENKTFQEAIEDEITNKEKKRTFEELNQKMYLEHGYYYKQITRLFSNFNREQIFVGLYEDMLVDRERFIRNIFSFLQISQDCDVNFTKKNVTSGGSRSAFINYIISSEDFRNTLFGKYINRVVPIELRHKIVTILAEFNKKKGEEMRLDDETRKYLKDLYRKDIMGLEELLKRDLSMWLA